MQKRLTTCCQASPVVCDQGKHNTRQHCQQQCERTRSSLLGMTKIVKSRRETLIACMLHNADQWYMLCSDIFSQNVFFKLIDHVTLACPNCQRTYCIQRTTRQRTEYSKLLFYKFNLKKLMIHIMKSITITTV